MLTRFCSGLCALLIFWLPTALAADSGWLQSPQNDHASIRLRGDSQRLLLEVKLQPGWKTYWRTPGEGGIPPSLRWDNPEIKTRWYWPTPQRFDVAGISTQGYHNQVNFPLVMKDAPAGKISGTLTLSTCSNVCILTDYPFTLNLAQPVDGQFSYDFAQAMGHVPAASGLTDRLQAGYRPGEIQIEARRTAGWQHPALFLDNPPDTSVGEPVLQIDGDTLSARIPVSDEWGDPAGNLRGKPLSLVVADSGMAQQSTLTIGAPLAIASGSAVPLWQILLLALAGGLILNLMPCVLPVLAMKLGSILQIQQRERRAVRGQFLASSAGIIAAFIGLALLMTLLRLSNQALGWGIQFQNPWFIALMVAVTVLFSANLFGLFHIRLPSGFNTRLATHQGSGHGAHFLQGVFATLLATPCSAPFLGTAVAFALAASLPQLWVVFIALGAGMSLPWLLIAAWPTLALRLPRPGRWMNALRIVLGLMMLASCLWLLSLMAAHIGLRATLISGGVLLLFLLAALWRQQGARQALAVSAVALCFTGLLLLIGSLAASRGHKPLQDNIHWQPLSEQAISQALAQHKRVFVDVTADWCVTCKANKFNVILNSKVQKALQAPDVVALRGDWTRPSKTIQHFLQARHSLAIPFNQIYGPGLPQGKVLSPLLTTESVLTTLEQAKGVHP